MTAREPVLQPEGARGLRRALREVEGGLEDLRDTHRKVSAAVVPRGRAEAPRRTGTLANSVRGSGTKTAAVVRGGSARVPYANPIHWGWPARNITANPWLSQAAQETQPQWEAIYHDDVQALTDRAIAANADTHA